MADDATPAAGTPRKVEEDEEEEDSAMMAGAARGAGAGSGGGAVAGGEEDSEEADERQHYYEVAQSFYEYTLFMRTEVLRRYRQVEQLRKEHKALLPMDALRAKHASFVEAVQVNQAFLDAVIHSQRAVAAYPLPPAPDRSVATLARTDVAPPTTAARHFSKAKSTLHQLVREWAADGQAERNSCFGVLLAQLQRVLPVTPDTLNERRVLCPGSGLGRLPLEVAAAGYLAQGNEFSYQMLMTGLFMLNSVHAARCVRIHPWIHDPNNQLSAHDGLRTVLLPDLCPADILARNPGHATATKQLLSMVAGEFLEVYGKQIEEWDAVLSCFFLDTAPNVLEYLQCIWRMLKPGGYLINFGPLLYHWQGSGDAGDVRYQQSIELSYAELKHVMKAIGFVIEYEQVSPTSYCRNHLSLMATQYTGICFVAKKPDADSGAGASPTTTTSVGSVDTAKSTRKGSGGAGSGSGVGAGAGAADPPK